MKIQTRLQVYAFIAIALAVVLGAILFLTAQQVNESRQKIKSVDIVLRGVNDLNGLTYDFLLHPGERAKTQWQIKHDLITKSLDQSVSGSKQEQEIIHKIITNNKEAEDLFLELVDKVDQPVSSVSADFKERLTSQLSIKLEEVTKDSFEFANIKREISEKAILRASLIVFIFIVVLTSLMLAIIYLTNVSIGRPLASLSKYTAELSSGNMEAQIAPNLLIKQDEIGQLAKSFNEMTVKLKQLYSSLEEKVQNKTKELNEKLDETEKLNKVMIDRELKMVELKKEIEELKKLKRINL